MLQISQRTNIAAQPILSPTHKRCLRTMPLSHLVVPTALSTGQAVSRPLSKTTLNMLIENRQYQGHVLPCPNGSDRRRADEKLTRVPQAMRV